MSKVPPETSRSRRMTLDEWAGSFEGFAPSDPDERRRVCVAARQMYTSQTASEVIANLEALAVKGLAGCAPSEHEKAEDYRFLLLGVRRFWLTLKGMADDADLSDEKSS